MDTFYCTVRLPIRYFCSSELTEGIPCIISFISVFCANIKKTLLWFSFFLSFFLSSWQVSFDSPLPASQQPKNGDAVLHGVLRVTTSSGVQVYKAGDVVKLDTKPIIYGKVLHFVKVSKKNDVDKVAVQRQPEEVSIE